MFVRTAFHSYTGDTKTVIQLGPAMRFNGGGHINHSIFWTNLSPNGGGDPEGTCVIQVYAHSCVCREEWEVWLSSEGRNMAL